MAPRFLALLFLVAAAAQGGTLSISGSAYPTAIGTSADVKVSFNVYNPGHDAVLDGMVLIDIPDSFGVQQRPAFCDDGQPMRCWLGNFKAGAAQNVDLVLIAPPFPLTAHVRGTVGATTADVSFVVNDRPDMTVSPFGANVQVVDPGQTVVANFEVLNSGHFASNLLLHFTVSEGSITGVKSREWSCASAGDGFDCTLPTFPGRGLSSFHDTLLAVTAVAGNSHAAGTFALTAQLTESEPDAKPSDNVSTLGLPRRRWIDVTNTADDGDGSLRAAIRTANHDCAAGGYCRIAFQIPAPVPETGWFTIQPKTPLPTLTAMESFIDGSTQTTLTGQTNGDGPVVAIDGRFVASGDGIAVGKDACRWLVNGLAIGNFPGYGISVQGFGSCRDYLFFQSAVTNNFLGVDPSGKEAWPNLRGVFVGSTFTSINGNTISHNQRSGIWIARYLAAFIVGNRIEANGASGVYVGPGAEAAISGNQINDNVQMGVALDRDASDVAIQQNSMRGNGGLPIDVAMDGVSRRQPDTDGPGNPPVILSAKYDPVAGATTVTMSLPTTWGLNEGYPTFMDVELYANDGPNGQGEQPLGAFQIPSPKRPNPFTVTVKQNLAGKWITATDTRTKVEAIVSQAVAQLYTYYQAWTSEMSGGVRAE